eukprot:scaffold27777_cov129-Isochrysis_galbana.AAC.11
MPSDQCPASGGCTCIQDRQLAATLLARYWVGSMWSYGSWVHRPGEVVGLSGCSMCPVIMRATMRGRGLGLWLWGAGDPGILGDCDDSVAIYSSHPNIELYCRIVVSTISVYRKGPRSRGRQTHAV